MLKGIPFNQLLDASIVDDARTQRRLQIHFAIRDVLLNEWDPIGVAGAAGAEDEYDGYLGPVHGLLAAGASAVRIARYLYGVEREHMEVTRSAFFWHRRRLRAVAELLRGIDLTVPPCHFWEES